MRRDAAGALGEVADRTEAVVAVPVWLIAYQRQATKDAGAVSGLNVPRLGNDPAAAAVACGLDVKASGVHKVPVFGMVGSSSDVSLVTIGEGIREVKATAGDTHLGGEDLDHRVVACCMPAFRRKGRGKDLAGSNRALGRLRTQCERAKRALSAAAQAAIGVGSLPDGCLLVLSVPRPLREARNRLLP